MYIAILYVLERRFMKIIILKRKMSFKRIRFQATKQQKRLLNTQNTCHAHCQEIIALSQVAQQYRANTARYRPMLMSIDEYR